MAKRGTKEWKKNISRSIKHSNKYRLSVEKRKGKSYEELYGENKALEIKKKIGKKSEKQIRTKESNIKRSETMKRKLKTGEAKIWNEGLSMDNEIVNRLVNGMAEKTRGKKQSESHKKNALFVRKENARKRGSKFLNPEKSKKNMSDTQKRLLQNPEYRKKCLGIRISRPQKILFYMIQKIFPEAELEKHIRTRTSGRYADILIPIYNVVIEYDGLDYHKDMDYEVKRDAELNEVGYKVLHYRGYLPSDVELREDIYFMINNAMGHVFKEAGKVITEDVIRSRNYVIKEFLRR